MTERRTTERSGRSDWALMNAQHDAFRRDLNDLLATSAGRRAVGPTGPCSATSCFSITPPRTRPCGRRCAPSSPATPPASP